MNHVHASPLHVLATLVISLVAGGCATPYRFTVDAFGDAEAASGPTTSYQLVEARPLGFDSASGTKTRDILRTALSSCGMFEAPPGVAPDLTIGFEAGISGPVMVTHTYAKPEYVVHQVQVPAAFGGCGGGGYVVETRPELQPAQLVTEHVLEYRKHLELVARTAHRGGDAGPGRELWRVRVENQDGSRDLGRYVTLMAAAALDLIGRDAQTRRTVTLTDRDGRVLFIEVGMP